jgi:K+-sensing histidine kinase KdpD
MTTRAASRRDRLALLAALLVPVGVCAALVPVRTSFLNTDAALVLVAVVVAVAANGHRLAGVLAALSAAVWFDFFLTEPYERFTITRHTDLQTTLLLLGVGVAITELAVWARRQRWVAAADEAFLAVVASTSTLVAAGELPERIAERVCVQLTALLGLRGARFEPGEGRERGLRLAEDGALVWGDAAWDLPEHGFPNEPVELAARHGGVLRGRFVLDPVPGAAPALEARHVAVLLAQLAASAFACNPADNH